MWRKKVRSSISSLHLATCLFLHATKRPPQYETCMQSGFIGSIQTSSLALSYMDLRHFSPSPAASGYNLDFWDLLLLLRPCPLGFSLQAILIYLLRSRTGIPNSTNISSTTSSPFSPGRTAFFTGHASPPMMLADPGKIREEVTPPNAISFVAASYGFIPSRDRTKGVSGPKSGRISWPAEVAGRVGHESTRW